MMVQEKHALMEETSCASPGVCSIAAFRGGFFCPRAGGGDPVVGTVGLSYHS
jgi:hypothetical protein